MLILKLVRENLLVCIISLKIKILLNTEIGNSNFNYAVKEIGLAWHGTCRQANYRQIYLYYNAAQGCPKAGLDLPYGSSYSTQTFPGRLSRYKTSLGRQVVAGIGYAIPRKYVLYHFLFFATQTKFYQRNYGVGKILEQKLPHRLPLFHLCYHECERETYSLVPN